MTESGDQTDKKTSLVTRNIMVANRRTSVRLEPELWDAFYLICDRKGVTVNQVCTRLQQSKTIGSLTSALRVFIVISLQELIPSD